MKKIMVCFLLLISSSSFAVDLPANYHINCMKIEVGGFSMIQIDEDINQYGYKSGSPNEMEIITVKNEKFILSNLPCIIQPLR